MRVQQRAHATMIDGIQILGRVFFIIMFDGISARTYQGKKTARAVYLVAN